jgi:large subunit ribosomal protein L9
LDTEHFFYHHGYSTLFENLKERGYTKKEPIIKLSSPGVFILLFVDMLMKVLLLADVPKIGKRGEVKEVNQGYANNFLIKKHLAEKLDAKGEEQLKKKAAEQAAKKERELKKYHDWKTNLEKRTFSIEISADDKGHVFGGVREKDILAAIEHKTNLQFEKNQIELKKTNSGTWLTSSNFKIRAGN